MTTTNQEDYKPKAEGCEATTVGLYCDTRFLAADLPIAADSTAEASYIDINGDSHPCLVFSARLKASEEEIARCRMCNYNLGDYKLSDQVREGLITYIVTAMCTNKPTDDHVWVERRALEMQARASDDEITGSVRIRGCWVHKDLIKKGKDSLLGPWG